MPSIAKNIIKKCKNIQTIYESEKIKDYHIYANDSKTENVEVIKNIEDIVESIYKNRKIKFEQAKRIIETKSTAINAITKSDIERTICSIITKKREVRKIGF